MKTPDEIFAGEFSAAVNKALQSGAGIEQIILALELTKDDLLALRRSLIAKHRAQAAATAILPVHQMPNGRQVSPPGT